MRYIMLAALLAGSFAGAKILALHRLTAAEVSTLKAAQNQVDAAGKVLKGCTERIVRCKEGGRQSALGGN